MPFELADVLTEPVLLRLVALARLSLLSGSSSAFRRLQSSGVAHCRLFAASPFNDLVFMLHVCLLGRKPISQPMLAL